MQQNSSKGLCIAALILGLVAIVFSVVGFLTITMPILAWVGLAAAIVGLVLSVIAKKKAKANGEGRSMATAGLITSIVALVVWAGMLAYSIFFLAAIGSAMSDLASMM